MFSDPTFYVLVAFLIFFAFAGKPLFKAITSQLDSSISKIGYDIDLATQQKDQAQQFLNDTKLRYHNALKLSQDTLLQAHELSQAWRKESDEKIKQIVEKKSVMADQRIQLIKKVAIDQIKSQLADLTLKDLQSMIAKQNKSSNYSPIIKAIKDA
jgi:F-type H+-transporting ATPase subunit b